jgi:glucose-1-phosphate cytidylyltransferase
MVMQVVILCGGQGTRIRDVSADIPKPMISVGHQPILWHIMKGYAVHGITDFVLCLGYKSWVIKRYFPARPGLVSPFSDDASSGAAAAGTLVSPARSMVRAGNC